VGQNFGAASSRAVPRNYETYIGRIRSGFYQHGESSAGCAERSLPVAPKLIYAKVLPEHFKGTIGKVEFDLGPAKVSTEDLRRMWLERFASAVRN
jgi:hypothetical protein